MIEVGVDVPNASLMVIEHAERFGLAQLHQLRGRVGRGAAESTCYLLFEEPLTDTAKARLKVIYETTDGFEIARQDLVIRGPGEFLGSRQSGVPLLRFADLERDVALIEQARDDAEVLLQTDPAAAAAHLARWLGGQAGVHQGLAALVSFAFSDSSSATRARNPAVSRITVASAKRRGMCCGQFAVQPRTSNTIARSTSAS